jgi:hypothetical protein
MFSRFTRSTLNFFGQSKVLNAMQGQYTFKDRAIQHVTMVQKPEWQHDGAYARMIHTMFNIGRFRGTDKTDKPFYVIQNNNDSLGMTRNIHESKEYYKAEWDLHQKWLESDEYNRKVVHPDGQVTWQEVKYESMEQLEWIESLNESGEYYAKAEAHRIKNRLPSDRSGWEKMRDELRSKMHITQPGR